MAKVYIECNCADCEKRMYCLNYITTDCEECDGVICKYLNNIINDCGENKKYFIRRDA